MIYDVTVPINDKTPVFPGDPAFNRSLASSMEKSQPANTSFLKIGAHTGTHIDAPIHMIRNGMDVCGFEPEQFVGSCRVIEVKDDLHVTERELKDHDLNGVQRLLIKTRNSSLWKQTFSEDFVYMEPDATLYLAKFGIRLLGFDYLSIEQFGRDRFPAHLNLMKANAVILEGLDLSSVGSGDFNLFCGPLRLVGSDGAPARVFLMDSTLT